MEHPAGESDDGPLQVDFGRRLRPEFHGSRITSDAGLLASRALDGARGLSDPAGSAFVGVSPWQECPPSGVHRWAHSRGAPQMSDSFGSNLMLPG